ncbi:MAG TPA: asparagine synthase (glutamine-hydrolyzing) [Acidobacteria bacterium]|nr:asparagine synthase (glutamine-hydrolyzing) [Acidobacteriota bacterium]
MCGICGIVDHEGGLSGPLVQEMRDRLVHRGPDDAGIYLSADRRVALGHRRLSIIDLSPAGRQPLANEDGSVQVVFNGEIYNYRQLRQELERQGHVFRSHTDTEVLVHLYEEMGDDLLPRLEGQFALALWDEPRRRLLLARDHFGKKPLYYRLTPSGIAFASELKALLVDSRCPRRIDREAFFDYLTFQYVPEPRTIFEGIAKLPAGHALSLDVNGHHLAPYWSLSIPESRQEAGERVPTEALRRLLEQSVRSRLVADVPVGVFLSGGVDSSAIVATMASLGVGDIRTFSVGFADKDYDETDFAAEVAERFGTRHERIELAPSSAIELIPTIAAQFDEPLADQAAVPTYLMCREARRQVKVCLSGEGGDETFGGYPRYMLATEHAGYLDSVARGEKGFRQALSEPLAPLPDSYVARLGSFTHEEKRELLDESLWGALHRRRKSPYPHLEARFEEGARRDYLQRLQYVDLKTYLPDNLLVKVDRASMLASLEVRAPMLDPQLVRFGLALPRAAKISGEITKLALKMAFRDVLPARVLWRPKMGFSMPLEKWFHGDLENYTRQSLLDDLEPGVFRRQAVESLVARGWASSPARALKVWTLLMYQEWRRAIL